jgi:hypothetical protein
MAIFAPRLRRTITFVARTEIVLSLAAILFGLTTLLI